MKKFTLLFLLLMPSFAWAQSNGCMFCDGGYCVDDILTANWQFLKLKAKRQGKDDSIVGWYSDFETVWDAMIKIGYATTEQKTAAYDSASKAGGVKIGGVNLIVLAAEALNRLVESKVIDLTKAQKILDESKIKCR